MKRILSISMLLLLLTVICVDAAAMSTYEPTPLPYEIYDEDGDFDTGEDYDGYADYDSSDSYDSYDSDDGYENNDVSVEPVYYDGSDDSNSYFDMYNASETVGEGVIVGIDEDYENTLADEPIEFDDSYAYIIFDSDLYFEDNDIYPDPIQFPDVLVSVMVDWDFDTSIYPYKAMVRTRGSRLNLRSGPSTDDAVIGHLENGTIVLVCARSLDNNWAYVVAADGRQGFVYASYLTTAGLHSARSQTVAQQRMIFFTAVDLNGNEYTSDELFSSYRAVMINNWATWCTYCKGELDELERICNEMAAHNCTIIGVVRDAVDEDTAQQAREILAEHGVTYINLLPFNGVDEVFPLEAYPTSFFVDSNGNLLGNPIEGAEIDQYVYRFYDIIK